MRIIVCVKQVPDTTDVRIDPKTNTLIREGMPSILNPYDQFAVEEAVRLKGEVIALSMGPPQARSALMKCLALGADRAVLLTDRAFAGADTWATSYTLSLAVRKIGGFDLILCGQQAIDGDTAQVGPELAQHLGLPQVTYVESVERANADRLRVRKQTEDGYHLVEVRLPALLALMPPTSFTPGYPSMSGILKAKKKPYVEWNAEALGGERTKLGLEGSFTQVVRIYTPPLRAQVVMVEGEGAKEKARRLAEQLSKDMRIKGG